MRFDVPFEAGPSRDLHLRTQAEEPSGFDRIDPPEVEPTASDERRPGSQVAAKTGTAYEPVHCSP